MIYPGAEDTWYDGIDSNCDGMSDYDADGDGHDSDAYEGDDCDDMDAARSPSAADVWYDGIDTDCDGMSDYDADGDGHDSDAYEGDDCDDAAASVYPGAVEECDTLDSDCDGSLVDDLWDDIDRDGLPDCVDDTLDITYGAAWQWSGTIGSYTGSSLASYGDQLIIGASSDVHDQSRTYLIDTDAFGIYDLEEDAIQVLSSSAGSRLGIAVLGTENSEGEPQLIMGMSWAHALAGMSFPSEETTLSVGMRGDPAVIQTYDFSYCGYSLASGRLLTSDVRTLLVGCPNTLDGAVVVAVDELASASSSDDLGRLGFRLSEGIDDSDDVGLAVAAGDIDGDGMDDAVVGAPKADFYGRNSGAVHVYMGPIRDDLFYFEADGTIWGNETEDFLGGVLNASTDWNGDGTADLVALAGTGPASWDSDDGTAHFFTGASLLAAASRRANDGFSTIYADGGASWEYASLLPMGDVDGDDRQDLLIGVPLDDLGGERSGALYTVLGPIPSGTSHMGEGIPRIAGEPDALLGWALLSADLNGDGVDEVVVSTPGSDQVFGILTSTLLAE
jgi:hypothetical protein